MIDAETIEEWEDTDGEHVLVHGFDSEAGEWRSDWIHVEDLEEAGRTDILRDMGLIRRWAA
jgi:hypothetical protein